ncbi:MAG: SAM-dependent methyltransferase [Psychrobium sp.]
MTKKGSLVVVGTGILIGGDISVRGRAQISQADQVFFTVPDEISKQWIKSLNPNHVDLAEHYGDGKSRLVTYNDMTENIISAVKAGKNVCAAFYGHPGVFVYASHEAIKKLKAEGFNAHMEPGISAEDCLFADLSIDPARSGCMSIEATQFLFYQRSFDPYALTVLWQIGLIGDHSLKLAQTTEYQQGMELLKEKLLSHFPDDHQVIIYEAATISIFSPRIEHVAIKNMSNVELTAISTLIIPPLQDPSLNPEILEKLKISENDIKEVLSDKK